MFMRIKCSDFIFFNTKSQFRKCALINARLVIKIANRIVFKFGPLDDRVGTVWG